MAESARTDMDWRRMLDTHVNALERALETRTAELAGVTAQFDQLKADFVYNLTLLTERDNELAKYDTVVTELNHAIKNKDRDISELRIAIEQRAKDAEDEKKKAIDAQSHTQHRIRALQDEMQRIAVERDAQSQLAISRAEERARELGNRVRELGNRVRELETRLEDQRAILIADIGAALQTQYRDLKDRNTSLETDLHDAQLAARKAEHDLVSAKAALEQQLHHARTQEEVAAELKQKIKIVEWELMDEKQANAAKYA